MRDPAHDPPFLSEEAADRSSSSMALAASSAGPLPAAAAPAEGAEGAAADEAAAAAARGGPLLGGPATPPPVGGREDDAQTECAFFMRTGTCAYGDRCRFLHPADRPPPLLNSRGFPRREEGEGFFVLFFRIVFKRARRSFSLCFACPDPLCLRRLL